MSESGAVRVEDKNSSGTYAIPRSYTADLMADALGHKFEVGPKRVMEKNWVGGPLGLIIPLQWDFSHGRDGKGYFMTCWKISGMLYMSVAVEAASNMTTVVLLDKNKLPADAPNLSSFASKGEAPTLDDYIAKVKPLIVGIWMRTEHGTTWSKVAI